MRMVRVTIGRMRTLMDEQFAPITSMIGFLKVPLAEAADGLERWRKYLYKQVRASHRREGFPDVLRALEPLIAGARPRELLVSAGEWTAYFDCLLAGTDPIGPVSQLCLQLKCHGLAIAAVPHTFRLKGIRRGRMGGVKFELFGPERTNALNYIRSVATIYDGNRWVFDSDGTVQPYEELDSYSKRRVRDRFTSDMLERYCQALGLDVFNPETYGPDAILFESSVVMSGNSIVMTLSQVQESFEIQPGMARDLPG
jgi:hypothetical protein